MKRPFALLALTALIGLACVSASATAASTWCGGRGKIMVLGDSLSTGYGTTGYTTSDGAYQATDWGWVSRLDAKANTTVVNLAHNGARASDFLHDGGVTREPFEPAAVWRAKAEQPDLIIIELGANEYIADHDPIGVYQRDLETLAARLQQVTDARLMFIHNHHFDRSEPGQYTWDKYGAAMKTAASGHWYLDLSPYLPSARHDSGLYLQDENGIPGASAHTNDQGHSAYFAAIWGAVQC